jgi:hypothetical protein
VLREILNYMIMIEGKTMPRMHGSSRPTHKYRCGNFRLQQRRMRQ